jgi:hypothetical protein
MARRHVRDAVKTSEPAVRRELRDGPSDGDDCRFRAGGENDVFRLDNGRIKRLD